MTQTRLLAVAAGVATIAAAMSLSHHIVHGKDISRLVPRTPAKALAQLQVVKPGAIPPFSVCSRNVDVASLLPGGAHEDPDVVIGVAFITLTEQTLLQEVAQASSLDLYHKITLLGKTEIYDTNLSPSGNIACATCHVPYTGFRGQSSVFNATTASQPGGIPNH